jgi:hypothetical protein
VFECSPKAVSNTNCVNVIRTQWCIDDMTCIANALIAQGYTVQTVPMFARWMNSQ